jgi:CheY-like chemotaxis protein
MLPILIVEDNQDSRDMMARILRYHQLDFEITESAEEALERLIQQRYAAMVIDLALPQMDGWTLLQQVRHNPQTFHLNCVAVTAYHSPELAGKAIHAGFNAYFPKPLEKTAFAKELRRAVDG